MIRALTAHHDAEQADDGEDEHDDPGRTERRRREIRQDARQQGAAREAAHVREQCEGGGLDPAVLAESFGERGGGRAGDERCGEAGYDPRDEQRREVLGQDEDHGSAYGQQGRGDQDGSASHLVGQPPEREQADHDSEGVDGEDHGDGERREPERVAVERVERCGRRGARHGDPEGEGHAEHGEAATADPRAWACLVDGADGRVPH